MDEIRLSGMQFFGRHGVNPEENSLGQRFRVDFSYSLDLTQAAASDDMDSTVSYSTVYKIVRSEVEGEPSSLLEHLAGRLLRKVLNADPRITSVRVTVTKVSPPLKGSATGEVSVTMERDRSWLSA